MSNKKAVNNINCSVYGCHSKKGRDQQLSFHLFPQKNAEYVHVTNKFGLREKMDRRKAWEIKLLMGKPVSSYMKVCSLHFKEDDFILSGFHSKTPRLKKIAVPSENLPMKCVPDIVKFRPPPRVRTLKKLVEKRPALPLYQFPEESTSANEAAHNRKPVALSDAEKMAVDGLLQLTYQDKGTQVKSGDIFIPFVASINSEAKLISLTGILSFQLLETLVELFTENFPDKRVNKLTIRERIIITFMKMKTGLRYVVLAVLFGCITSKTSKIIFEDTISKLAMLLKRVIRWPTLEECQRSLPNCFKNFSNVRVVLDCTELAIQKRKNLYERIMTYSHYKGHHTIKFMTGVSPAGLITFVSEAYGGKASDNAIFEQSRLIDMLEMGRDAVMVDKGFRIDDITDTHFIKLIRPPFLRKKSQFTEQEAKQNIEISRARVHIERANQRIKVFEIFMKPLPLSLASKIDDIFFVACAIVNLSRPILGDDKFL